MTAEPLAITIGFLFCIVAPPPSGAPSSSKILNNSGNGRYPGRNPYSLNSGKTTITIRFGTAKPEAVTVKEVIIAFLNDSEARVKPKTISSYKAFLKPFSDRYGSLQAEALTTSHAEAYSRKPTWSNSTRHDFLSALSVAFRWAERTSLFSINPLRFLKKPPMESRGEKALISEEDHLLLLNAAPSYFKPFLQLLHLTGARPSEVAGITAENFMEKEGVVRLRDHKTAGKGKSRTLFLSVEAVAILKKQKKKHPTGALLRGRYGSAYSKNAITHMMRILRKKTGARGTAYGYRHTYATDALAMGLPEAHVSELLGHSSTAMLHKHYAHLGAKADMMKASAQKVRESA